MRTVAIELPDDIEALKALVLAARGENAVLAAGAAALRAAKADADADARIERLHALLKVLERARYGRRSEALDPDQHAFVFEEVETDIGAVEAGIDAATSAPSRDRTPRPRKRLPEHLERIELVIDPQAMTCACGCETRVKIGEDVSERLDVVPTRFRVIVTRRPRYACAACHDGVVQAPAPPRLIEAGIPTEGLLAHIAVAKYGDGLPLYRQEAIYARDRVELGRSLMTGWMGRVGFHLEPLADRILQHIRTGERVFADETTLPTLAPGTGKTKAAWLWAYARDDRPFGGTGPPMVAYRFEDSCGGDCPARHLAVCWAHLRRRFYELHAAGLSETASWTVEHMAALWAIEQEIRGRDPAIRRAVRQRAAAPIVAELFERWEAELRRIPGKGKLAEAIRYALRRRDDLERFIDDGRIEIDTNIVERAIRPQTITRKNALFTGSDGGGRTWATIATLLTTAKLNGVDPYAWLKLTLERIADGWPNRNIDALMPWNHQRKP